MRTPARAIGIMAVLVAAATAAARPGPTTRPFRSLPAVTVYKDATCLCCASWVTHMRNHGFATTAIDRTDMPAVKDSLGVPAALRSCHTAVVGGYIIEGHVPAELIERLLAARPVHVRGLAVPGMVTGSPGMEGPHPQAYDVIAFDQDGTTHVYAHQKGA